MLLLLPLWTSTYNWCAVIINATPFTWSCQPKRKNFLCLHLGTFQNVNACSVSREMHHLIFSCGWDNIYWKSSCLVARMGQIYPTKIPLRDRDRNRNEVITETLFLSPYEDFCPSSFLFLFLFLYSYFLRIRTDIPYSSLPCENWPDFGCSIP